MHIAHKHHSRFTNQKTILINMTTLKIKANDQNENMQTKRKILKLDSWEELKFAEKNFVRASEQFSLINKQYEQLKLRYDKAKEDRNSCFRYNLRLKLSVIEGVRGMYYEYLFVKADDITMLRRFVRRQSKEDVDSDDDMSEAED